MSKQIIYGEEARKALQAGIDKLSDTVKSPLARKAAMSSWIRNTARRSSPTTV